MQRGAPDPLLGIFVGGRGTRMGGAQKALLRAPDGHQTLLERTRRIAAEAGLEVVLVGSAELGPAAAGLVQLSDAELGAASAGPLSAAEPRVGPLAGLAALLSHAGARPVLALGCDMPYVTAELLRRLVQTRPDAVVLAARDQASGKWQPLFARYDPMRVSAVLARELQLGARSFQALFAALPVEELALSRVEAETLRDWDTPEDMR